MKRIYFSLLLLALSIAGALYQFWYVSSKSDEFTKRIEERDEYMLKDDFASAIDASKETEDDWSETANNIDIFLIHDYVDSISLDISQLSACVENGNPQMYFMKSASIKKGLTSLKESEYPVIANII